MRRVGFNLLYLVPEEVGGSEIYARNLLGAIRELEPDLELTLYVAPEALESLRAERWAEGQAFVASPVRSRLKPLRAASELTWLPVQARRDGVEVLHSLGTTAPPFGAVPSVVTVLDLIYHHFPETFPAISRAGLRLLVPAGARRAARVIAIAEAGKKDMVETLGLDPARIDVIPLGYGFPVQADPTPEAELRERYRLGDAPLVLAVAAALRHKNLGRLIDAFAEVAAERQAMLVLVGHAGLEQDALRAQASAIGLGERVRFTGWIEDRELEGLYAAARLFVHPSLFDGYALPVLEAMRRGVAVACSNTPAVLEVSGDAAETFDPHDTNAIATAMRRLLDDPRRRDELVARGNRRYPEFSWERTARATLAVYRDVLARRSASNTSRQ